MMQAFTIAIPGHPATKKNSAVIARNRSILLPSAAYRRYEEQCREYLAVQKLPHFTLPVRLCCRYWLKDRAHWPDLTGLMQATADIISDERKRIGGEMITTREWLLADDRIIRSWDGTEIAGVDKLRPRVEITITPLEVGAVEMLDPYIEKCICARQIDRPQQRGA